MTIQNKKQLKEAIKNKYIFIKFQTAKNEITPESVGKVRELSAYNGEGFALKTKTERGTVDSWIYYRDIDVKDNEIIYKAFDIVIYIYTRRLVDYIGNTYEVMNFDKEKYIATLADTANGEEIAIGREEMKKAFCLSREDIK